MEQGYVYIACIMVKVGVAGKVQKHQNTAVELCAGIGTWGWVASLMGIEVTSAVESSP